MLALFIFMSGCTAIAEGALCWFPQMPDKSQPMRYCDQGTYDKQYAILSHGNPNADHAAKTAGWEAALEASKYNAKLPGAYDRNRNCRMDRSGKCIPGITIKSEVEEYWKAHNARKSSDDRASKTATEQDSAARRAIEDKNREAKKAADETAKKELDIAAAEKAAQKTKDHAAAVTADAAANAAADTAGADRAVKEKQDREARAAAAASKAAADKAATARTQKDTEEVAAKIPLEAAKAKSDAQQAAQTATAAAKRAHSDATVTKGATFAASLAISQIGPIQFNEQKQTIVAISGVATVEEAKVAAAENSANKYAKLAVAAAEKTPPDVEAAKSAEASATAAAHDAFTARELVEDTVTSILELVKRLLKQAAADAVAKQAMEKVAGETQEKADKDQANEMVITLARKKVSDIATQAAKDKAAKDAADAAQKQAQLFAESATMEAKAEQDLKEESEKDAAAAAKSKEYVMQLASRAAGYYIGAQEDARVTRDLADSVIKLKGTTAFILVSEEVTKSIQTASDRGAQARAAADRALTDAEGFAKLAASEANRIPPSLLRVQDAMDSAYNAAVRTNDARKQVETAELLVREQAKWAINNAAAAAAAKAPADKVARAANQTANKDEVDNTLLRANETEEARRYVRDAAVAAAVAHLRASSAKTDADKAVSEVIKKQPVGSTQLKASLKTAVDAALAEQGKAAAAEQETNKSANNAQAAAEKNPADVAGAKEAAAYASEAAKNASAASVAVSSALSMVWDLLKQVDAENAATEVVENAKQRKTEALEFARVAEAASQRAQQDAVSARAAYTSTLSNVGMEGTTDILNDAAKVATKDADKASANATRWGHEAKCYATAAATAAVQIPPDTETARNASVGALFAAKEAAAAKDRAEKICDDSLAGQLSKYLKIAKDASQRAIVDASLATDAARTTSAAVESFARAHNLKQVGFMRNFLISAGNEEAKAVDAKMKAEQAADDAATAATRRNADDILNAKNAAVDAVKAAETAAEARAAAVNASNNAVQFSKMRAGIRSKR